MYQYRYGGKKGTAYNLVESPSMVAVRTATNTPAMRTVLSSAGKQMMNQLTQVGYFPESSVSIMMCNTNEQSDSLFVRDQARALLKKEDNVRFAGRVLQEEKSGAVMLYTENFFVKFFDHIAPAECQILLAQYSVTIKTQPEFARNAYYVAAPEGTGLKVFDIADQILNESIVEYCHPELVRERRRKVVHDWQWHLKPQKFNNQSINAHANIETAWSMSQGAGTIIAIIDDGVDTNHPEFAGKIVAPRDTAMKLNDALPKYDSDIHGTACAGIACASGIAASGVAPLAQLMPIRSNNGLGTMSEADAFYWAANMGADIIACSWGPADGDWENPGDPLHQTYFGLPDSTRLAIEYAVQKGRGGKGCIVVWAAGNGNENVVFDGYASCEHVITVAACNDQSKRSVYSDFGKNIWCCFPSNDFGSVYLNHPMPSTFGIYTTDRMGGKGFNPSKIFWGDAAGDYTATFGGTSAACPGVAGVIALMLSVNKNLSRQDVQEIIKQSCDKIDLEGAMYDADGHSIYYGYGRINAAICVQKAIAWQPTPSTAIPDIVTTPIIAIQIGGNAKFGGIKGDLSIESGKTLGGLGKRLLGFNLTLQVANLPVSPDKLGLSYTTVIHNEGKGIEHTEGEYAGTTNSRKRCIGFAIRLTGTDIALYDVVYTAQIKGKSGIAKALNGEFIGTTRKSGDAIEAISIALLRKQ